MEKQLVRSVEEGKRIAAEIGFPIELHASFVLKGWHRIATTTEELQALLAEGLRLSPVNEVALGRA